ncbi:MAG: energy transducer TonB [Parvibaculaceae bacterium]|nr:energy transducer TonB [Parvibaculaceae bacterium]
MKNILCVVGVCTVVSLAGLVSAPSNAAPAVSQNRLSAAEAQWSAQVRAHFTRFIRYPRQAYRRGETGVVWVDISLDRQGKVIYSRIRKSSGHALLDRGALRVSKRASPFPSPPATVEGKVFKFSIPMNFSFEAVMPDLSGEWQPPLYPSSGSFQ